MKKIFLIIIFLCLALGGVAQYEEASSFAETITSEDLIDYLTILSSDALEGRETGERGQKMAAAFIAYHFENIGLKPVVKNGDTYSYYQRFALEKSYPGEIYITIDGTKKINGEDLIYWGRKNMDTEEQIQAVFVGAGSEESFQATQVAGKAAVIFASGAGFQGWRSLSDRATKNNAAVTFLVVADNADTYNSLLSRFKNYFMGSNLGFKTEGTSAASGGVFLISQSLAAQLLKTDEEKLMNAVANYDEGNKKALQKIKPATFGYKITRKSDIMWTENVLGYLEGTDKKEELVIITSHYDHIGKRGDEINNGADDNGSGTSSVMEIAQAFAEAKRSGHGPRRSMLFMTVTGEEKGLLGSQYYVENPVFPLENTVVDFNIDMIGRHDPEHDDNLDFIYLVGSDKLSSELHELSEMANSTFTNLSLDYTYNDENHPDRIYYRSDHWNFAKNDIPVIFYFSGFHADYHKPTDTIDKIEFDMLEQRARLVYYTAWVVANREDRIVVDAPKDISIESKD